MYSSSSSGVLASGEAGGDTPQVGRSNWHAPPLCVTFRPAAAAQASLACSPPSFDALGPRPSRPPPDRGPTLDGYAPSQLAGGAKQAVAPARKLRQALHQDVFQDRKQPPVRWQRPLDPPGVLDAGANQPDRLLAGQVDLSELSVRATNASTSRTSRRTSTRGHWRGAPPASGRSTSLPCPSWRPRRL